MTKERKGNNQTNLIGIASLLVLIKNICTVIKSYIHEKQPHFSSQLQFQVTFDLGFIVEATARDAIHMAGQPQVTF